MRARSTPDEWVRARSTPDGWVRARSTPDRRGTILGRRGPSRLKLTLILVASGLLVGSLVAGVSVATAAPFCTSGVVGADCRDLVATLARRAGLVAGGATVLMLLLAAGLVRMLDQDDRDRAERAMEAYRESKASLVED